MKSLLLVLVTIVVTACSFDNKTGIWKDATNTPADNQIPESIERDNSATRYEKIFVENKIFNEEIENLNPANAKIDVSIKVTSWPEQYAIPNNNISNFSYNDNKKILAKSSKLSKSLSSKNYSNKNYIFYKNNIISYDHKGTIFIYSLSLKKKIFKYNFYKKNFKNYQKEIYLIINDNILYAADNLGYIYALNLNNKNIIWAKNYGIPFRSNLKFTNSQIFLANQDNVIYSINAKTGDKNWQFATTLTFLKSDFKNNIALDLTRNNLFFLNTSGELYSINYSIPKINWVLNFKNASLAGDTELFLSHPIVIKNNNLIISTEKAILNYDVISAQRKWNFSSEPITKPIVTLNYTYVVLKNDLLICLNNINGEVVWSKNIFRNIGNKKINKKFKSIIDFKIVNDKINIYFTSGYLLSFNFNNGKLNYSSKISKNGINTKIFFLNNNMYIVDNNNRLLKYN